MVIRYSNVWAAVPALLVIIVFVVAITFVIKIWMFSSPSRKRIIPAYSLHVMKEIPPDYSHRRYATERNIGLGTTYDSASLYSGTTRSTGFPYKAGYTPSDVYTTGSTRSSQPSSLSYRVN